MRSGVSAIATSLGLCAAFATVSGGGAFAQEGEFGALATEFERTSSQCWSLDRDDETAIFTTTSEEGGCGRILIENTSTATDDFGRRTIRVWVEQPETSGGSAGMLYGFDESLPFHYAFLISSGGRVLFGRFFVARFEGVTPDSGYSRIIDIPPDSGLLQDGPNELRIDEDSGMLLLSVNGVAVGWVGGARLMGDGRAGIAVLRFGDFVFHGYQEAVHEEPVPVPPAPVNIANRNTGGGSRWGPLADAFDREIAKLAEGWTAERSDDELVLSNPNGDAGMALLFPIARFDDLDPDVLGRRTITATVAITADNGNSRAGIVYWHSSSHYYLFTLSRSREGERRAILWAMDDGTPQPMTSIPVEDRAVELGLVEDGTTLGVLVDGEIVSWVQGTLGLGEGLPGLAAWGPGTYVFSGYDEALAPAVSND